MFWCYAFHFHQGVLGKKLANEIHNSLCSRNTGDFAHYLPQLLLSKAPHENFLTSLPARKGCVSLSNRHNFPPVDKSIVTEEYSNCLFWYVAYQGFRALLKGQRVRLQWEGMAHLALRELLPR